jgi:hypothetical protein
MDAAATMEGGQERAVLGVDDRSAARICGRVTCEELAGGPLLVSAHAERHDVDAPVATTDVAADPGEFSLRVPPGTWWLQATLEQAGLPGPRAVSAWCHDPVTVGAGQEVAGVQIVVEVPEQVR